MLRKKSKDVEQEFWRALDELVFRLRNDALNLKVSKNNERLDRVLEETKKLLAKVYENGATKVVKFDRNDETTFPKNEGCYFAYNEANVAFIAFWAEFAMFVDKHNVATVIRKRRWITDYEVALYIPIPLTVFCGELNEVK